MSSSPRSRRHALLTRENWARRLAAARQRRVETYRNRSLLWRLLAPTVFVVAGTLFVTSAVSSDGTDLRAGRYGNLESVVQQQKNETDRLRARANALSTEVQRLSESLDDTRVSAAQSRVDALEGPAGMEAVAGPAITVTLDDAPDEIIAGAGVDANYLVVHQQDIQAVANALWTGGAEAMTVQDQRIISTTGIKCVGNTVRLHGVPYAPPYEITAVGDPSAMLATLNENPYIDGYLDYVDRYQLGWDVEVDDSVQLPSYEGSLDLDYARVAGDTTERDSDL